MTNYLKTLIAGAAMTDSCSSSQPPLRMALSR